MAGLEAAIRASSRNRLAAAACLAASRPMECPWYPSITCAGIDCVFFALVVDFHFTNDGSNCRRIYSTNQKVLNNCAFIRDFLGFQRCVLSLMKVYDLREFFGGMSCYHNGEAMARCLGVQNPERFTNGFMEDSLDGSRPDPVMLPSKVTQPNGEIEYCIGLRVWDLLLWFAIVGRPRRDVGILTDFAKTMAQYSMQILPRSILPYSLVLMTRLDPVEKKQVVMDWHHSGTV